MVCRDYTCCTCKHYDMQKSCRLDPCGVDVERDWWCSRHEQSRPWLHELPHIAQAEDIVCPKCGAGPGVKCVTPKGKLFSQGTPHEARWHAVPGYQEHKEIAAENNRIWWAYDESERKYRYPTFPSEDRTLTYGGRPEWGWRVTIGFVDNISLGDAEVHITEDSGKFRWEVSIDCEPVQVAWSDSLQDAFGDSVGWYDDFFADDDEE